MADDIYHRYKVIAIIGVCFCTFFAVASLWIPIYLDYFDKDVYLQNYLSGKSGDYPIIIDGIERIQYNLLYLTQNLSENGEVILIGGSTTRQGIVYNYSLNNGYSLKNFGMSSNTPYSDRLLLNYIKLEGNRKLNHNDIIVFHIYFGNFMEKDYMKDITKSNLDRLGAYTIDESGDIKGSLSKSQRIYLESIQRYNTFMSTIYYNINQMMNNFLQRVPSITPQKYNNKYEQYHSQWNDMTKETHYPRNVTADFEKLLIDTKNVSKVIVVNLYVPSWLRSLPAEQEYEMWLNESLIPFLSENQIYYLDLSRSIPDDEFRDAAHLNRFGRENYTRQFDVAIKNLSIFTDA